MGTIGDAFIYSRFSSRFPRLRHGRFMKLDRYVATPPPNPLMIFDGDCDFCRRWIRRWSRAIGNRVECLPFQDPRVPKQFPALRREILAKAVHFAEAAFRALAHNPAKGRLLNWYLRSPSFANFAERAYRFVAEHRTLFSRIMR